MLAHDYSALEKYLIISGILKREHYMNILVAFFRLKLSEKLLAIRIAYLLYHYKIALPLVSVNQLTAKIEKLEKRSCTTDSERLLYFVKMASLHLPWANNCLLRSLVGKRMLQRQGKSSTIKFGAKKLSGHLEAHAWLENIEDSGFTLNSYFKEDQKEYRVFANN